MAEKEQVLKEKVTYAGVFDFKGLYACAHKWLKNENYWIVEDKYTEKVAGSTKDILIEWTASKKLSDYFKVEIKVKFDIADLSDVEIEIDGKKKKANKGKVEIEIKGNLIRDPDSKWEERPVWRFLRDTYNKYIIPKRAEDMQDIVDTITKGLKEELKAYLELLGKR
jgi:hypothetical protein